MKKEVLSSDLRSLVEVEVAVLGCPPLIVRTVSVDVKQHLNEPLNCQSSGTG